MKENVYQSARNLEVNGSLEFPYTRANYMRVLCQNLKYRYPTEVWKTKKDKTNGTVRIIKTA